MLDWLFRPGAAKTAGRALYANCARAAREPGFYTRLGVPDTVEGRFELYAIHVLLVVRRLRGEGEAAAAVSQALFDALLMGLDDGLREMGVGDLSVGKKMRRLGEAIYGRARNLDAALDALLRFTKWIATHEPKGITIFHSRHRPRKSSRRKSPLAA